MNVYSESLTQSLRRHATLQLEQLRGFWRRFNKNRAAVGGLCFVVFLVIVAIFAPWLAPRDPIRFDLVPELLLLPPQQSYPFGTDQFGRDVLSRIVWGARVSLLVGFLAATVAGLVGITLGSVAGYKGGRLDHLLMRATDVMLTLPTFFLILMIALFFGPSIFNIVFIIGLTSWPTTARLVRAEFLSFRERDFTTAARAVGMSDLRIMFLEILPNAIYPAIVDITLLIAGAIITEASLSFLGVGDANVVSWGWMLQESMRVFRRAPWTTIAPGLTITATVVALNLLGDGLNDALNPHLKER